MAESFYFILAEDDDSEYHSANSDNDENEIEDEEDREDNEEQRRVGNNATTFDTNLPTSHSVSISK